MRPLVNEGGLELRSGAGHAYGDGGSVGVIPGPRWKRVGSVQMNVGEAGGERGKGGEKLAPGLDGQSRKTVVHRGIDDEAWR